MLTKNDQPKCDECGRFVSWNDVTEGRGSFAVYVRGDMLGNVWEEIECYCQKCKEKLDGKK